MIFFWDIGTSSSAGYFSLTPCLTLLVSLPAYLQGAPQGSAQTAMIMSKLTRDTSTDGFDRVDVAPRGR